MGSHHFNVVVVLFWCATMSWLVVAKVIPPLRVGEPPTYLSILQESEDDPPVCWTIRLHDRTIGWAANKMVRRKDGMTELVSRVYLGEIPLEDLVANGLGTIIKPLLDTLSELDIDKQSRLLIDPLGRLVEFNSRVRVGNVNDAIKVRGEVEGSTLKLSIQSGQISQKVDSYLPPNALMGDELSPQVRMPGLRVGQTWTVPLYTPLGRPDSPLEILQARVDREDKIGWDGRSRPCRVIVYLSDPSSSASGKGARARMWVDYQGLVLRQEVSVLHSHVHFIRIPEQGASAIDLALGEDWTAPLSSAAAKQLLHETTESAP